MFAVFEYLTPAVVGTELKKLVVTCSTEKSNRRVDLDLFRERQGRVDLEKDHRGDFEERVIDISQVQSRRVEIFGFVGRS